MTQEEEEIHQTWQKQFLSLVIRSTWIFLLCAAVYQAVFFPQITNLYSVFMVALGWFITTKVFLRPKLLNKFPLSAFIAFGFTCTQLYFPLIFTTLEDKPLIFNLLMPEQVFLHSIASLCVLVVAHFFYRLLSQLTYSRSFSIMERAGFFTPPTVAQIWTMGLIGMASMVYVYFGSENLTQTGSSGDKFIQGFIVFTWAPYFIPFGRLFGAKDVSLAKFTPWLVAYTLLLFLVSMGINSRGAFMFGFTAIGFTYLLGLLLGEFKARIFTGRNVVIGLLTIWLLMGPIADLGTTMVIVREKRDNVSAMELIELTLESLGDKQAISEYRANTNSEIDGEWDERYLDNIFTARFANIKFNDASLVCADMIREYDPDMLKFSADYLICILPDPIIQWLGFDVDKAEVYSLSFGDYLYIASGGSGPVGGFRVGHFSGTGMATFGWWYLLFFGVGVIPVYFLFDKFLKTKNISDTAPSSSRFHFSFCGIISITSIFLYFPVETVVNMAQFIIRNWIQLAFLYIVVFHLTRIISRVLSGSQAIRFKRVHLNSH